MKTTEEIINQEIKNSKLDTNLISDGYHTFGELYEHRITLFIALCKLMEQYSDIVNGYDPSPKPVWKSKAHSDGSVWEGWFILGMGKNRNGQITYHLPISKWDECNFEILEKAPEWDGHTSADVLERLKNLH